MRKGYRYYGAVWMSAFCLVCLSGCGQRTAVAGNPGIGTGINSSVAADGGSEAGNGRDTGAGGSEAGADRNTGDAGLKPGQAPADTAVLSGDARTERFEILDADDDGMLVCGAGSNGMSGLFRVGHGSVLEDADGKSVRISELKSGMIVELSWEGYVLESYPGQFSYQKLRITQEKGSRELEFYYWIICFVKIHSF